MKSYIYWSFTQSNIAQQIPEHASIPIRPARWLATIRANSLRSDRALGGSNQRSPHNEIEAKFMLSAVLYSTADNQMDTFDLKEELDD